MTGIDAIQISGWPVTQFTNPTGISIKDIGNSAEDLTKTIKDTQKDLEKYACDKYAKKYAKSGGDYETGYKIKQQEFDDYHKKNG